MIASPSASTSPTLNSLTLIRDTLRNLPTVIDIDPQHGIHNVGRVINHQGNAERRSRGEVAGPLVAVEIERDESIRRYSR
jgi:hypothetical protein